MRKEDLRIVFMGTPEFAVETLKALVENEYNVVAVVTQPDKAVGRHQTEVQPSEVKKFALEKGLPVLQPEKMKDPAFVEELRSYKANLQVVVAFRMLPEVVWDMPAYGTFNVHAALLPQYRGAAPINWAVINGETQTGVTTFFLDKEIDTGRIIMQKPFDIPDEADVEYVYDGLMHLGADICLETLEKIIAADGHPESIPQAELEGKFSRLYDAPKLFKNTCEINWERPCKRIYDFIRGLSPYPGAWTTLRDTNGKDTVLKIFKSECSGKGSNFAPGRIVVDNKDMYVTAKDGLLKIIELQLAGKKRMAARDFLNGIKNMTEYQCICSESSV
ncbi:MAG: methionyl-tRNA formyltransferase [Prevotella sp.]|nr:methionyl-tRNA formyltransferase [Prevotella sp.]